LLDVYAAREAQQGTQAAVLAHMQSLAGDLPALRKLMAKTGAARAADAPSSLITGATDAIAAANLQNVVQQLAADARVTPSSIEVLPVAQQGAFRRIGLQIETTTSWPTLIALLEAMDESTLALIVDDLTLNAIAVAGSGNGNGNGNGNGSGQDANHPALDASFMVFAFRAAPASSDRGSARSALLATNQAE
jgi:hypothetical protein